MADYSHPTAEQAEEINASIRYAAYSVFRVATPLPQGKARAALTTEVDELFRTLEAEGLVVRGVYDVSALRADADFMVWWHAERVETVQRAYQQLRQTALGQHLEPVWSNVAIHRPAEFNRGHVPAFLSGHDAKGYLCVYPFVRSYDWYVMDAGDRSRMLREHGEAARDYKDVLANTLASFALGDYEFLLAFEADELHRIVDLMRELRNTEARLHVREEVPFYTGPRVELPELVAGLP
ncbi:hydrogen peroxide-dependent heme synthase [Serinicoccus sediminis]|uniref:hydrogen peroxide-dependent heme synthase n=1 Tax=Serinicoccus sediminis TaxID=2306021 RepID=UPI00101F2285|nr:hydrogen peroxide-dependent heme synthase [Serinicoccus sediminis]